MPNHVTNRLEIIGNEEQVKDVLNYIKSEEEGEKTIDFNKIIPMPKDLDIEVNMRIETMAKVALREEYNDNPLIAGLEANNRENSKSPLILEKENWDMFIQLLQNKKRYGAYYWYDWRIENWGTKWNAYNTPDGRSKDNILYFQTAWSYPEKIIKKLSEMFKDVKIKIWWADEDLGNNVGMRKYIDGNIIAEYIPEGGSLEAKKLFFKITGDTLEEHYMNENYEYEEEL